MEVEITTGTNYDFLTSNLTSREPQTVCLEGGGRSGKTWDVIKFLLVLAFSGWHYYDNDQQKYQPVRRILITGELWSWLKIRAYQDFLDILERQGLKAVVKWNKSAPPHIEIPSRRGYTVEFVFIGADDADKFKGPSWDIAFINEAVPGFSKEAYEFIRVRTRWLMILDWNPLISDGGHWAYDVAKQQDVLFFKSTVLTNKYAPAAARKAILSYEPTPENIQNGTANPRLWRIFGLGERASYDGLVYQNNWFTFKERPTGRLELVGYGQDFGFSNDPSATVSVYKLSGAPLRGSRGTYFVETLFYSSGVDSTEIADELVKINTFERTKYIACDHESEIIDRWYNRFGLMAIAAKKPRIQESIDLVLGNDIYCLESDPINKERLLYCYKPHKSKEGVFLSEPIDKHNHAMDAMRYVFTTLIY